jgi:hypothetical protein
MTDTNKEELLIRKNELEARLQKIKSDISEGLDADSEERAIQLQNRDVLLEIRRVTEEELQKVNAELQDAD